MLNLLLLISILCMPLVAHTRELVRAAIDIGSSGPRLRVAEIDVTRNKIIRMLHVKYYPILFYDSLSRSGDGTLSAEMIAQGIAALKEAIATAGTLGAEGVAMVGASVFRTAANGKQFAQAIEAETGVRVHVLDQDLEGKLAFQAALAKMDVDAENLVVWDIGCSTQWTSKELTCGSETGSGFFRDLIIAEIQHKNLKEHRTPNPISSEDAFLAGIYASFLSSETVSPAFKEKLRAPATKVVGVGSVFPKSIAPRVAGKNSFTIEELTASVQELVGKSDEELGGGDFACVEASNVLLVLGMMKRLGIREMSVLDVNNAEGAMLYAPFWEGL